MGYSTPDLSAQRKILLETVSPPTSYGEAVKELLKLPAETARLMTGIEEYIPINSIQREV